MGNIKLTNMMPFCQMYRQEADEISNPPSMMEVVCVSEGLTRVMTQTPPM